MEMASDDEADHGIKTERIGYEIVHDYFIPTLFLNHFFEFF